MREQSLKKRYLAKLFSNIISAFVNMAIVFIVPKALGPTSYGLFMYLQNFFNQMMGFLDIGTSSAFFVKLSANNSRKSLFVFYSIYILCIFIFSILFIYALNSLELNEHFMPNVPQNFILIGFLYSFLLWLSQIFIKISDAYAITVSVEFIKIVHKILMLLLLIFFVYKLSFDLKLYYLYNFIFYISFIFILILFFYKIRIFKDIYGLNLKELKDLFKEFYSFCHPLFFYTIVTTCATVFDIWLLQKVSGSIQSGFYGLVYGLVSVALIFTSSMTQIIIREFSKEYEIKNYERLRFLIVRYVPMLYSIATFFSVFVSFHSDAILAIFINDDFKGAWLALSLMAFYPLHQTYGQIIGGYCHATLQTKLNRNIALFFMPIGSMISVIMIYFLNLGATGLVVKMVLLQAISTNVMLFFATKDLNIKILFFIKHQIYSLLFFVLFGILSEYIAIFDSIVINFIACGIFYVCLCIIGTIIFPQVFAIKPEDVKMLLKKIVGFVYIKLKG